jgi:hypothetical protein
MDPVVPTHDDEREAHVRTVVSTLKSLADATESATPRQAVERVGAKLLVHGLKALDPPVKEAARPRAAITLAILAERQVGADFVDYDVEALVDLGFSHEEVAKLKAAQIVLYDTAPFEHWHVFEKVAVALNDRELRFDHTQDLSVPELAWAADAMRYIDEATPWGHEVAAYIAGLLHDAGFVVAPAPLAFAADGLSVLTSDYGQAVARRHAAGATDAETAVQRDRIAEVMAYVNARHQQLHDELKKV